MDLSLTAQEWAEIANLLNDAAEARCELSALRDKVRGLAIEAQRPPMSDEEAYAALRKFYGEQAGGLIERVHRDALAEVG